MNKGSFAGIKQSLEKSKASNGQSNYGMQGSNF